MSAIVENEAPLAVGRFDAWKAHLAALAVLLLLTGAAFFPDVKAAAIVWWVYPAYSHCFLIIPISAWLIWERRAYLISDTPAASPWALVGVIPCLALWLAGGFGSVTEFRQFAAVGLAEVFCVAILGRHIFRKISFACLYLFFLVPTGQYLIPPLQEITAKFVEIGLSLFSIPFFREGLVFDLVNGSYQIAEACAGLRFLIATVALGVLFAHMMFRKPLKIAIFLASCFVIPVIGNGIRALVTVMVANYTSNRVAAGFDHIVYGWAFAVAIIFVVMYIGARFRDTEADKPPPSGALRPPRYGLLGATALGAFVLLSFAPAVAWYADRTGTASQSALEALTAIPGWDRQAPQGDWRIAFDPGAAETAAALQPGSGAFAAPVDIDISYYLRRRGAPSLMSARNHSWDIESWHSIARQETRSRLRGGTAPFHEAIITAGTVRRLVWTTYWVDGRFAIVPFTVRLLELHAALARGHSAVIALSTPITSSADNARRRLATTLAAFPDLSAALRKVGDAPSQAR